MKKSVKTGIILFILSISYLGSFSQVANSTQANAITIPAGEAKLVLAIMDESDFNKTVFDWRLFDLKDAQTASAIASGIKSKHIKQIKSISITPSKGTTFLVHLEANAPLEAYQYFQMFLNEGVKYALINEKAVDLAAYIRKKTGK
ncbi:MAG: hypothetical protein ACJ76F_08795 [Bacteroidia bacterium]